MMKNRWLKTSVFLLALGLLLLVGACAPPVQPVSAPATKTGLFSLFLQPLPQESHRLSFRLESLVALREDGVEIPLLAADFQISDRLIGVQQKILSLNLPPAGYLGIAFQISSANLLGEEGPVELLAPRERLIVELPFLIQKNQSETLFLSLSADRLVTDGVFLTPKFSLWKPDRLLTNLKGFVCNSRSQNLTVFNKRTAEVVGHIQVGEKPVDLVLDQQRKWLYVALAEENAIAVVEVNNGAILGRIPLRFGDEPSELVLTANGKTLLSLNRGSESVSVIDTASLFEIGRIRLLSEPTGIFLSERHNQAYVTHSSSSTLSVINLQTRSLQGTVSLEDSPIAGVSSRDGRSLYLINNFSTQLTVLDSGSLQVLERIFIGDAPFSILSDATSELFYIGKQDGEIAVVDPRSLMAIDTYSLPGPIQDMTIDNEENALFAVLPESNSLLKIDLISKRVLGRLTLEVGSQAVVVMGER